MPKSFHQSEQTLWIYCWQILLVGVCRCAGQQHRHIIRQTMQTLEQAKLLYWGFIKWWAEANNFQCNIGNYWLRLTTWYIHCKIANFVAQQATLSNIACQATLAFVAETKLLIAIIAAWMKNWIAVWPNKLCHRFMPFVLFIHLVRVGGADDDFWVRSFQV